MKIKCIVLLVLLFMIQSLAAQDEQSLTLKTVIPEDYGITIPDVLKLDRLVFAVKSQGGETSLVEKNLIDAGVSNESENSLDIVLLYYGNLESPYDVYIKVDPGFGFLYAGDDSYDLFGFPLTVRIEEPEEFCQVALLERISDDYAHLTVFPTGPVRGEEVLVLAFEWEAGRNVIPGKYSAEIWLELAVN